MEAQRPAVELPAGLPLNDPSLPQYVRDYIEGRGFSVDELTEDYKLQVSQIDFYPEPCIIIPIYQRGELASWQARFIGEDSKERLGLPKYYNPAGARKSWQVYNMDRARMYDTVVLTEGVFDVYKVGAQGVALFGKVPSGTQLRILAALWGRGRVIILPDRNDPDSLVKANENKEAWLERKLFREVHVVQLDADDPGSCDRREIWRAIASQTG
jgi:hypothetical protein